jgi:hypothetical protein
MMNCLDMEKVEIDIEDQKIIQEAGFMNRQHYDEHKSHVVAGLVKLGSTFSIALGHCLDIADLRNSLKILRYWNHLCEQHALFYKMYLAEEEAKASWNKNETARVK